MLQNLFLQQLAWHLEAAAVWATCLREEELLLRLLQVLLRQQTAAKFLKASRGLPSHSQKLSKVSL